VRLIAALESAPDNPSRDRSKSGAGVPVGIALAVRRRRALGMASFFDLRLSRPVNAILTLLVHASTGVGMRKFVVALVVASSWSLGGCGSSGGEDRPNAKAEASASADAEASKSAEAEAELEAEKEAEKQAARAAAQDALDDCEGHLGGLLEALKQIDGRLDVGLTNADLTSRLGDVAVTYNDIPFKKLSVECVQWVGVPLENAYNEYSKSVTKWDACIDDYYCSVEGAKLAELQGHWSKASKQIEQAKRALSQPKKFMNSGI
jgi:outer membrane murein-binding lipoprotein Lpp